MPKEIRVADATTAQKHLQSSGIQELAVCLMCVRSLSLCTPGCCYAGEHYRRAFYARHTFPCLCSLLDGFRNESVVADSGSTRGLVLGSLRGLVEAGILGRTEARRREHAGPSAYSVARVSREEGAGERGSLSTTARQATIWLELRLVCVFLFLFSERFVSVRLLRLADNDK